MHHLILVLVINYTSKQNSLLYYSTLNENMVLPTPATIMITFIINAKRLSIGITFYFQKKTFSLGL